MADWVASGHLVEAIVILTIIEWFGLSAYNRLTGRGVASREFSLNLLSGMALLLALRAALIGDWWGWVTVWLTGALVAHLADLARRWVK